MLGVLCEQEEYAKGDGGVWNEIEQFESRPRSADRFSEVPIPVEF